MPIYVTLFHILYPLDRVDIIMQNPASVPEKWKALHECYVTYERAKIKDKFDLSFIVSSKTFVIYKWLIGIEFTSILIYAFSIEA